MRAAIPAATSAEAIRNLTIQVKTELGMRDNCIALRQADNDTATMRSATGEKYKKMCLNGVERITYIAITNNFVA